MPTLPESALARQTHVIRPDLLLTLAGSEAASNGEQTEQSDLRLRAGEFFTQLLPE